jgi:hypothetical protein
MQSQSALTATVLRLCGIRAQKTSRFISTYNLLSVGYPDAPHVQGIDGTKLGRFVCWAMTCLRGITYSDPPMWFWEHMLQQSGLAGRHLVGSYGGHRGNRDCRWELSH